MGEWFSINDGGGYQGAEFSVSNFVDLGLSFLSGCAHVISKNLRPRQTCALVQPGPAKPEAFKGKTVIWGGEVVETRTRKTGAH